MFVDAIHFGRCSRTHLLGWTLACLCAVATVNAQGLVTPRLFVQLPDICPTPDGMALDPDGNIIVACPNYADMSHPAVLMKIDEDDRARLYAKVPTHPETGVACPMGIQLGPDGALYVCDNQGWPGTPQGQNQGRILRLVVADGHVKQSDVVAHGMSHPNGIRIRGQSMYVTQSMLPAIEDPDGLLVSGVYRFDLADRDVKVANTRDDSQLIVEYKTRNRDVQYGADGLVFDKAGNLYVGNFGDGAIHKTTFDEDGNVTSNSMFARTPGIMRTTDGICMDDEGNIYVADFSANAVCMVDPQGKVVLLAKSPDCDGSKGGLDQPGEPIVRGEQLIVTNFDMVTGPDKVNSGHDRPYTMSVIDLTKVHGR